MKQKLDHYSKKKLHVCLPHGVFYPSIVRGPCRREMNGWFAHESGIIEAHWFSRTKQTWNVLLRRICIENVGLQKDALFIEHSAQEFSV